MSEVKYDISKERCASMVVNLVCDGCGGKLTPIETVNNAKQPTFWPHCEKCQVYCWGTRLETFKIASHLFDVNKVISYTSMKSNEYMYRERQIRGNVMMVLNVLKAAEVNNALPVFDATTFGPDEVPVEYKAGFSTSVLVDMDGNRDNFLVGKYDHIEYKWKFLDGFDRDTELIRWSFLPLAIYDTNPELRKTIKL